MNWIIENVFSDSYTWGTLELKVLLNNNRLPALVLFGLLSLTNTASAIIVGGTSANNAIYAASGYTGVGFSVASVGSCSGSLLSTGMHFLTAAHCILGATGNATINFSNGTSSFSYTSVSMIAHPDFSSSSYFGGADLAIVTLGQIVDASISRYSLYSATGELGQTGTIVGYGREGIGTSGGDSGTFGTRRQGQNQIDTLIGGNILYYDFDNGLAAQSTSGGLGLGVNEVSIYRGDSGGPTFIGNQIAGIHSFISCTPPTSGRSACGAADVDGALNGTFGERFGDTRVSTYAAWINSVTSVAETGVPEPSTYATGLIALLFLAVKARKTHN